MKILLVEDDLETAEFISNGLKQAGEVVYHTSCPKEALMQASITPFDVIIFDRLLPSMDGLDAVKVLRASNNLTPIIMLTALSDTAARVEGLEAGADDYLVKPFALTELHARLKALHRRQPTSQTVNQLRIANVRLIRTSRRVFRGEVELELMPKEYQILEFMMLNPEQLVTKTMLLEHVWGFSFDPKTSLVQTHMSRLRNKLDKPFETELIKTIRGSGYIISER